MEGRLYICPDYSTCEKIEDALGEDIYDPRNTDLALGICKECLIGLKEHPYKPSESLHDNTAVLSYEVGRLLEAAMYYDWNPDLEVKKARLGFFKSELSDVAFQISILAHRAGLGMEELIEMGREKAEERYSGKEKKYLGEKKEGVEHIGD